MGRLETGRSGEESHDIWLLNEHKQNTFPWNVCRNVFPKIGLSGWTVVFLSVAYTVFLIFSSFLGAHIFIKSLKNVISYFNLTKHVRGRLPSPGMRARLKIKIWFFFLWIHLVSQTWQPAGCLFGVWGAGEAADIQTSALFSAWTVGLGALHLQLYPGLFQIQNQKIDFHRLSVLHLSAWLVGKQFNLDVLCSQMSPREGRMQDCWGKMR